MERLEGLKTGQEKWVKGKMDAMKELAGEEDRMLSRVTAFIEGFPLDARPAKRGRGADEV